MIHPSKKFMDQLYSLQKGFIWRERPPKIKHTTLIADYVDGGYKDVDIATKLESLKIILDILNGLDECLITTFMCGRQYHTLLISKNYSTKILNLLKPVKVKSISIPNFIKSLFSLWEKVFIKEPVDIADILSQPIWNNHFLQKQESTLFYPELYRRGVSCIRDIVASKENS